MDLVREDMEMVGARERETKLNESYVEDFRAVAFSNKEKPKEEE